MVAIQAVLEESCRDRIDDNLSKHISTHKAITGVNDNNSIVFFILQEAKVKVVLTFQRILSSAASTSAVL